MPLSLILGFGLGALAGAGVGMLPRPTLGVVSWAILLGLVGLFQAWAGSWILRQSNDRPKVRAAVPLSGAVLASLICVLSGEGFAEPVLGAMAAGALLVRLPGFGRR